LQKSSKSRQLDPFFNLMKMAIGFVAIAIFAFRSFLVGEADRSSHAAFWYPGLLNRQSTGMSAFSRRGPAASFNGRSTRRAVSAIIVKFKSSF
jgi:hypothetical protein